MGPVHFTDGFDRPDTIAFGLDAPRLVTVVVAALCAYAVMQAPLPFALRVCIAVVVALLGAVLGWARYAGRPLLSWAWLALRFVLAPRSGGVAAVAVAPVGVAAAAVTEMVAEVAECEAVVPVEDGVPVWAQWLRFEKREESEPPAAVPDVVEAARPAPVVVLGEPRCEPPEQRHAHDAGELPHAVPVVALGEPSCEASDQQSARMPDAVEPARPTPVVVLAEPRCDPPEQQAPGMQDAQEPARSAPGVVLAEERGVAPAEPVAPDGPERTAVLQLPVARPEISVVRGAPLPPVADAPPFDEAPAPVFVGAPRRVTFFSLNGGSGRTTLATEVACVLAARGRHMAADGTVRPLDVALLDLDLRSATVAVRLGIPQPTIADYVVRGADPATLDTCMVRHPSGVRALLGMPKPVASGPGALEPARVAEIVHHLEREGAQFVVIDVAADLGAVTTWVLSAAHDVFVVLTPTARGVQDAYRTTAALRRLGLGHKLRYVLNRAHGTVDLDEVMGDLGGRICAVIPDDPAVEDAENRHRIVALDGEGPAAAALHDLAALLYPTLSAATRRPRASWLPWRRRAG